jgi:hypothetical protein
MHEMLASIFQQIQEDIVKFIELNNFGLVIKLDIKMINPRVCDWRTFFKKIDFFLNYTLAIDHIYS